MKQNFDMWIFHVNICTNKIIVYFIVMYGIAPAFYLDTPPKYNGFVSSLMLTVF